MYFDYFREKTGRCDSSFVFISLLSEFISTNNCNNDKIDFVFMELINSLVHTITDSNSECSANLIKLANHFSRLLRKDPTNMKVITGSVKKYHKTYSIWCSKICPKEKKRKTQGTQAPDTSVGYSSNGTGTRIPKKKSLSSSQKDIAFHNDPLRKVIHQIECPSCKIVKRRDLVNLNNMFDLINSEQVLRDSLSKEDKEFYTAKAKESNGGNLHYLLNKPLEFAYAFAADERHGGNICTWEYIERKMGEVSRYLFGYSTLPCRGRNICNEYQLGMLGGLRQNIQKRAALNKELFW
jgi:hypothetical protein